MKIIRCALILFGIGLVGVPPDAEVKENMIPIIQSGHHFTTGLIMSPALPLGEAAHIFNPGLMPLLNATYNLDLKKGNLGLGFFTGLLLTGTRKELNAVYHLGAFPLAVQVKLSSKSGAFVPGLPLQIYLELGGGIVLNVNASSIPGLSAQDDAPFYPLAVWNQGFSYWFTPRISLSVCGCGMVFTGEGFNYFTYNPALRVDYCFF